MSLRLGFVGVGDMGLPMVRRLLGAGDEVVVCDVRPEAVALAVGAGALAAASAREVAAASEIVITCLPTAQAVRDVVLDPTLGLVAGLAPGSIVVETSTVTVQLARELADELGRRGVDAVDAPFFPIGIEDGVGLFMVGGDAAGVARARRVLDALGDRIVHVGPHGSGVAAKLAMQYIGICNLVVAAEAALLARSLGVEIDPLAELVPGTVADSAVFELAADWVRRGGQDTYEEPPGQLGILAKDIRMCVEAAVTADAAHGMASCSDALFTEAMRRGWGDRSFVNVFRLLEVGH